MSRRRPTTASSLSSRGLTVALLVLVLLAGCGRRSRGAANLVVITLDTLRADVLGSYGDPSGLSPNIDALARESIVFENATTAIGTTLPSHASLFTGLYPGRHGVRWNGDALDAQFLTLAEILAGEGYETAAFVSMESMFATGRMTQGFSSFGIQEVRPADGMRPGEQVNQGAIAWLRNRRESPFFLWLHYAEAHSPYRPTEYAERKLREDGYEGALAAGASTKLFYSLGVDIPWTEGERRAIRALYEGEVGQLDRLVGEVVGTLDRLGHLDDSIVVLTSDHGQALGEHGVVGHGFLLWQTVLQVPLIIRVPGQASSRRVSTRVGLVDLLPTVLDLLALPRDGGLDGRSLAPAIAGRELPEHFYFAEARRLGDNRRATEVAANAVAVLSGRLKATWTAGTLSVFDLGRDPSEVVEATTDLPRATLAALRAAAVRYAGTPRYESQADGPSAKTLEELRAMGYVQ